MNVKALTIKYQPATIGGNAIVDRKIWICEADATWAGGMSAPVVDTDSKQEGEYVLEADLWPDQARLDFEEATEKPNANILNLRMIIAGNAIADVDSLLSHLDTPPRYYPYF